MKLLASVALSLIVFCSQGQNIEAFGMFGGFNFPITLDEGLQKDTRYFGKFTIRGTPVGFSYGYDKVGHGYLISPNYTRVGQNFSIKNSSGGEIGTREVLMDYISVPVALKLHINDMAFFRLSALAAINFNYLISGNETLTYDAGKIKYPAGISVPTDPGYVIAYDGVFVPQVNKLEYVSKDKFNSFQLFAALGLRSDFDLSDEWSINFDGRVNFGIFDSRTSSYIDQLKNPTGLPDINGKPGAPDFHGQRREIYLSVSFGISRIIQSKTKFKTKTTTIRNRSGGGTTAKPRNKKGKK
jgi:Outer membrane protein beta-barrel domain